MPLADITTFFDAIGKFFASFGDIRFGSLFIGLVCFGIYLTVRSRAYFNVLRAAYPAERIQWRRIWGAYVAAYGFNNIIPARGGDVIKLFLTKNSVSNSSYPAIAASFFVELGWDLAWGTVILIFAFTQGVFPKPPDFAKLKAFDLSFFAGNPRFTLFLLTLAALIVLAIFAVLGNKVRAFWPHIRQGVVILHDRPRYFRQVFAVQGAAFCFRFAAFWFLLDAFNIGGSFKNVLLVLGVNAVAAAVPFTPGGAGVQQAFLVKVFAGTATVGTVASYSVGQQIAIAAFSLALGFAAIVGIFRFRSFKEVIQAGRADRQAASAADDREKGAATASPPGPRARA